MAQTHLRFEALKHRYADKEFVVPLLIDENRNPAHPFTEALLRAAEVIAPNLEDSSDVSLDSLVRDVDAVHQAQDGNKGYIIEDVRGVGAIVVDPEDTQVNMRGQKTYDVPTYAVAQMLHQWVALGDVRE